MASPDDWIKNADGTYRPDPRRSTQQTTATAAVEQSWWPPVDGGDVNGDIYLDGLYYNSTVWLDSLDGGTAA